MTEHYYRKVIADLQQLRSHSSPADAAKKLAEVTLDEFDGDYRLALLELKGQLGSPDWPEHDLFMAAIDNLRSWREKARRQ